MEAVITFENLMVGNPDIEKFFGISISPDKEVVLIVIDKAIKDEVVSAIYKDAGLDTKGQGIVFTLPVDDFVINNKK